MLQIEEYAVEFGIFLDWKVKRMLESDVWTDLSWKSFSEGANIIKKFTAVIYAVS